VQGRHRDHLLVVEEGLEKFRQRGLGAGRLLFYKERKSLLLLPEISGSYSLSLRMQRRSDLEFCYYAISRAL
jgi:hypothetical protein